MMPPGHVAAVWGVAGLLEKQRVTLDYRLLAVSALLPDLIDKPLALFVFPDSHSSQNIAHSLPFNALLLILAVLWWRKGLPYVLAFNGHLLADRMWHHTETFWWPLYGWTVFWQYKPMNTPEEMVNVYLDIITRYPQVWVVELAALLFLGWFVYRRRLYGWKELKIFIRTGHIPLATQSEKMKSAPKKTKNPLPSLQKHV